MSLKYYILMAFEASLAAAIIWPYNLATPYTPYETIQVVTVNEPVCGCDQLILPPKSIELPPGLGFGSSALPAVAEAYDQKFFVKGIYSDFSDAYVPVSSPCSCVKLATPCPTEIASLVHPVVL